MKRIVIIALAALVCTAADAKKKKETVPAQKIEQKAVINLKSPNDSINYACGYQQTYGLVPYLIQQGMDTTYLADFVRGMKEGMAQYGDPSHKAYNMGLNIANQVKKDIMSDFKEGLRGSPDSLVEVIYMAGFYDALNNDSTKFTLAEAQRYFQTRMASDQEIRKETLYGKNREEGKKWLAENAKKPGVVTLPSGLQYKVIKEGTGPKPTATEEVTVKYEGTLIDGTVFDSSYKRTPQTNKFKANQVIKGWTEALTLMPTGSTWELYIPQELAYGDREAGKIPEYRYANRHNCRYHKPTIPILQPFRNTHSRFHQGHHHCKWEKGYKSSLI